MFVECERAAVKEQFPDIRVLGENPYLWRHIILWSSETQVPFITDESTRRTEIIQKKIERDEIKSKLTAEEFLSSLNLQMKFFKIIDVNDPKFNRAFELINKTNQFNTTGKRWRQEELLDGLNVGKALYSFEVNDKFSSYGLVGSIICSQNSIAQFVMSCRVVGLGIELAAMSAVMKSLSSNYSSVTATFVETQNNLLCRDLFIRCGFDKNEDGVFHRDITSPFEVPSHVHIEYGGLGGAKARAEKLTDEEHKEKVQPVQIALIELPIPKSPAIPRGYEAIYERFLRGVLIYRPSWGSDVGKIELPIASLLNPLESTFDLSRCEDAGQYLSISTGYRKRKTAANASKYEVWIAPKFIVESDISKTAGHYRDIMDKWTAPYGIFYTWGGWEDLTWYDYLTASSAEEISSKDLYENWRKTDRQVVDIRYARPNTSKHFTFNFK